MRTVLQDLKSEQWMKLVDWAADHRSWGLHTALVEEGPQSDVDYEKLLKDFSS